VGDASGDGVYTALDVEQINRLTPKRPLDTGFAAYTLVDPVLVADVTGNGTVDKADAKTVERLTRPGGSAPAIPPIPVPAAVTASATALAPSFPGVADDSSRAALAVPAIDWNGLLASTSPGLAQTWPALPGSARLFAGILAVLGDGALDGASRVSGQVLSGARQVDWDGGPEEGGAAAALIEIPAQIAWTVKPAVVAPERAVHGSGTVDWDGQPAVTAKPKAALKAPKSAQSAAPGRKS
jgi:hypothetical protein